MRRSEAWTGFRAALAAILERSARRGASSAAALRTRPSGLDAEIDYDKLTQDIVYRKGGVNQIVNNFRDVVAKNLATTLREGGDRKELEAAIRASMDTWRDGHAETVAMTEAVHAFNEATLAVAEANGATTVRVTDGHDDDEPCIQADGATWDILRPRAPAGAPALPPRLPAHPTGSIPRHDSALRHRRPREAQTQRKAGSGRLRTHRRPKGQKEASAHATRAQTERGQEEGPRRRYGHRARTSELELGRPTRSAALPLKKAP